MSVLPIFSSPFFTVPLTLSMLLKVAVCVDYNSGQISLMLCPAFKSIRRRGCNAVVLKVR
jgi:hypothetical protein